MKKLLLIFILTFLNLPSFAYDVAFPLDKELTLEQDGVFFVGKANKKENVWINDKKVDIKKNGSFAETFKLLVGDNIFYVGNNENRKQDKYIITRIKYRLVIKRYKRTVYCPCNILLSKLFTYI